MIGRVPAPEEGEAAVRAIYAIGAAMAVAYAVWGSLLPFDFHRVPAETAARFWRDWSAAGATLSLSDLASNVLLFLPIGLCLTGVAGKTGWPSGTRGRVALGVFAAGVMLSGGIEFGQTFVSWRTPSKLDVAAEAVGTAGGIAIWHHVGAELDALLRAFARRVARSTRIERFLLAYCAVFAVAWWLPADFTMRPGEIGDKYEHKRLLLPFMPSPDAETARQLVLTSAAAMPLGIAGLWCGRQRGTRRSVAAGAGAAALFLTALEVVQVPVFSRTTDGTALLAAVAGAMTGAVAGRWARTAEVIAFDVKRAARGLIPIAVWLAVMVACEWWPFHFVFEPERARLQALAWSRAPFRAPANTLDVLPGGVLAAAAGLLIRPRLSPQFARLQTLLAVGCAAVVFLLLEIGRVVLAGGQPSLVSVLIKGTALVSGLHAATAFSSLRYASTRKRG